MKIQNLSFKANQEDDKVYIVINPQNSFLKLRLDLSERVSLKKANELAKFLENNIDEISRI